MYKHHQPKYFECKDGVQRPYFASNIQRNLCRKMAVEMVGEEAKEASPLHHFPALTPLKVERYKESDLVKWPLEGGTGRRSGDKVERAKDKQSVKSRMRCAFTILNAEAEWANMMLLSWAGEDMDA